MNTLPKDRLFWYKIPDHSHTGMKPCDVVGCLDGKFFAWEFKYHDTLAAFSYSKVTTNQVESLLHIKAAGGEARIFLGVKLSLTVEEAARRGFKSRFTQFVKSWDIDEYIALAKTSKSLSILEELNGRAR